MSKFSTFFPPPPPEPGIALHDHDHFTDIPIPDDYFLDMNYFNNLDDQSSLGFDEVSHDHDPDMRLEVDQRKPSNNNPWFTTVPPEVPFEFSSQQSVFSHQELTSTDSTSSAGSSFDGKVLMENRHMQEEFNKDKMKSTRSVVEFRTQTELETLDDGYRWRKYGKKKVKSNPNPRHYYKCSVEGCKVKKRVERDGEDSSYLVTGYDGKHNHASPRSNIVHCDRLPFLMLRPSQSNQ